MKQLKLFFALFAMLALGVGNAWAEEVTETIKMKGFGSKTNNAYQNVTVSGTSDAGTAMVAYAYNGCNGQVRGNKTAVAGASVTREDKNKNWSLYNSEAMGGSIKSITVTQTDTGNNKFQNNLYVSLGTSSQGSVTAIANAQKQDAGGTANEINFTIDASKGYTYFKLLSTEKFVSNSIAGVEVQVTYETAGGDGGSTETVYSVTLNQPANGTISAEGLTDGKAAEGTIVKLTATPTTEGYKLDKWTVTGASGNVAVTNNQFTMPAEDVTVTASFVAKTQYTIKWNVAEGSVADTKVYEGEALGSLPTAPNCSEGKVFIGWTAATTVNPDGSGITYVKATDVPTGNKEYNAVYAKAGATETITDELTQSWTQVNGTTYSAWTGKTSNSPAVYAGNSAGGNTSIQLRSNNSTSGIVTTTSGGKVKKVVVTWFTGSNGTASGRTLNVYGNSSAYSAATDLYADATSGTTLGTIVCGTSTELEIAGDYEYIGLRSNSGAMYLSKVEITWEATSYSDYSLDCEANNESYLTVNETSIDFGTVAQNATVIETLNVSGGYLAEDVTLTISGTNASFFSVNPTTIAKADEVDQDVTITYNPTATGDHTATLTIKTGDITKEIALSGKVLAPGKWALVTDASQLNLGDEIIIVAADANVALSTTQNTNNRGQAEIVKVGNTVNADGDVQILTLGQGTVENTYAFSTGSGYLYAAGKNSDNHLKTKTTLDATGSWAITIDNATGVATIKAQDSNTKRNWLRYNATNNPPIFSCYESGQKDVCVYRNTDVIAAPIISGNVDFTTETIVTITAQSGLTVYYTTNGNTPDKTATQYSAPFTISATTTVKAIAYDATEKASNVAEKTFTKQELVNVATAMALAKDEIAYFDEFEVVKVVAGKGNIYIKDASGHGLIYDNTLAGQLKDGDRVQGFVGVSSPYNGLPEAKPYNVTYEDLTITAGTPAEPYDFTSTVIAETDINKYIVFQNLEITENTDMSTNPTLTIGGNSVKFYNQFGVSKTLEVGKIYDIYGFVAVYEKDGNRSLQVYFYEAAQDGEVIQKYTVTYKAGGATGTVPVDNAEYSEGAQVYLKSATGLTYEGYEYKGWKVTDANGTEIPVSSNKFNMPASNVTVTAQWEEIVVTPRQDFSEGYWVLVTDASELAADDYIIVAAANLDVAMKSYESGNYCTHMTVEKDGIQLKWDVNLGVFQLAKDNENYTIQDVNTNQYLYAAGSGDKNYLKAANEIPTDADEVKKYIWTITIEDGVTTVKATSENRNTLQYNKTSGQERFSCYASGQEDIALYKYVTELPTPTPDYTRSVTPRNYGTICLPNGSSNYTGATFFEIAYRDANGVYLDEVKTLVAGVPYIFQATSTEIAVIYEGEAAAAGSKNGLYGTFTEISDVAAVHADKEEYILTGGVIRFCEGSCTVPANRAYIVLGEISTEQTPAPVNRRRISMSVHGENGTTGLDNIMTTDAPAKVIVNGQLIIIRDGVKYNVQGQKL